MVEDLLLASRFGDNPDDVSLEVVTGSHDAGAIVAQAVQDLGSDRITATLPDGPVSAQCDNGRTLQIVTNLVGNGLKYSAADQPVDVRLEHDDEQVRVVVRDHGRGIPADSLDKVFEKFYRVEDPMTMSTSGTGLGLFIARRLARAMGGDVTAQSVPNVGSVFTLALPRCSDGTHW
jgi:signal transduction histidine kinase